MSDFDARTERLESKWPGVGKDLLLALGILCLYSVVKPILDFLVVQAIQGIVFHEDRGALLFWALLSISAFLSSIVCGYVAARYLRFSWAHWAVLGVAVNWGAWEYASYPMSHYPESWDPWLRLLRAVLVLVLMPVVFLWQKRRLNFRRETEGPDA